MKFQVGDRVVKPKGYRFNAEVRAVFTTTSGEVRVVAENGDGLLYIFNEGQLELQRPEYLLDSEPFVYILDDHGGVPERAAIPHPYPGRWKWEPRRGNEQDPLHYDLETQSNYAKVAVSRAIESHRIAQGNTDVPCPHDGEMVNVTCWKCGWVR